MRKQKKPSKSKSQTQAVSPGGNGVVILQTSPITIGGGASVSIDFDHHYYQLSGNVYANPIDEVDTGQVFDALTSLKWELHDFVRGIDCSITIHTTLKNGTSPSAIIIRSKPNGPFSVEFRPGDFPLHVGSTRLHYNPDRIIVASVEVLNNSDQSNANFSVPSAGRCSIHFLNKR